MLKYFQYGFAYFCLFLFWLINIIFLLRIFEVIDSHGGSVGLALLGLGFFYLYERYRPMEFKELIKLIKNKFFTKG